MADMLGVALLLIYITGVVISGVVAAAKRRSSGAWILAAILATPLIALVALAAVPAGPSRAAAAREQARDREEAREHRREFWARWRANRAKGRR